MTVLIRTKQVFSNRIFHHLLFWSVVFSGLIIFNLSETFHMISFHNLFFLCALFPIPVYLHFYLLEKFFSKKKYPLYTILTPLLIITFASFFRSLFTPRMQASNGLLTFILNMTIFLVLTTGLKFLKSNFNQRILIQQNNVNRLQTELEMVKSGINTGFMMRFLRQLHQLSLNNSPRTPGLILQFAGMLRHTMNSSRKVRIEMGEEITYVREYLTLERQLNNYRITFEIKGDLKIKIIPLVLVFLTEKILSGIIHHTDKPVFGELNCVSDEKGILFFLKISKKPELQNFFFDTSDIEKKMYTLYGDRFTLVSERDEQCLSISVRIFQDPPVPNQKIEKG